MVKKLLFILCILNCALCLSLNAQTKINGIFVWVQGKSTCYQLTDNPKVAYEGNTAVLSIDGKEQLRLDVSNGNLVITFGTFDPMGIKDVNGQQSTVNGMVRKVGKYIVGGNVVIVKDGKQYGTDGKLLKRASLAR